MPKVIAEVTFGMEDPILTCFIKFTSFLVNPGK